MRNLKKFLALVLAMLMTFSLMVTVNAASPVDFPDGEKITAAYQEAVDVLSALKVVKGDAGTGNFRPASNISRAEAAAILYRVVTGDVEDKNIHLYEGSGYFSDLAPDAWYEGYVNYCANNGLILGRGNNKFDPDAPVTGYEALVMILRAIGYNNPKEFSDPDWKLKASGYGRRLGITTNIAEGSLGGSAKREVVAEIMFQGIQTTMVEYSPLLGYQNLIWYRWSDTRVRYADLLLSTFGIAYKDTEPTRDKWGNPSVQWVYWTDGSVAIEIPIKPVDTFYTAMDECDLVAKYNEGADIYVTNEFLNGRAVVTTDLVNGTKTVTGTRKLDKLHTTDDFVGAQGRETKIYNYTIKANGITSTYWDIVYVDTYLGVIKTKTPKMTDTNNHEMQKASFGIEVGAYNNPDPSNANHYAVLHVSDEDYAKYNVGDVVTLKTWSPSWWDVNASSLTQTATYSQNFDLKITWTDPLIADRLTTKASAEPNHTVAGATGLTVGVQVVDKRDPDNIKISAATGTPYEVGSGANKWQLTKVDTGVYTIQFDGSNANSGYDDDFTFASHDFDTDKFSIVGLADTKTVTITGTTGAATDKTGIYTADGTIIANIVFHMDNHSNTTDVPAAAQAANNGVTTTVADFIQTSGGARGIFNEQINKSYKLWLDAKGNILGMKPATAAGVGVVLKVEGVQIATGQYALKADLFMEDESTLTAMFLNDSDNRSLHQPFGSAALAVSGYADGTAVNGYDDGDSDATDGDAGGSVAVTPMFSENALVEIEPYTKNGQTFYKVVDNDSDYQITSDPKYGSGVTNGATNSLLTGVTTTLAMGGANRVNGNTVFFIAYKDFQYDWGTGNLGANDNVTWKVIRDFRDIPTIDGTGNLAPNYIVQQTLKETNNVAKYAAITSANFTAGKYDMTAKLPVSGQPDDSYLIIAPIGTYARYAEYSVMHNGVKETLKVANTNTGVNTKVETALASGQLIKVKGWNLENAAIDVEFITNSNVIKAATTVSYDNAGVLTIKTGAKQSDGTGADGSPLVADAYMTVAKEVKVMIVNRDRNQVYEGTEASIALYATATGGHAFAWELDPYGYISTLYILD